MPNRKPDNAASPGTRVDERLLALLKNRGFRVIQRDVQVPAERLRHGPRFDFLVRRGKRRLAVEVKAARGLADWFFHWLARPILMLQAVHRLKGWEPLLGVYVDHLEPGRVQRFKAQAQIYAPDLWWILADAMGNIVSHLPGGDEEKIQTPSAERRILPWDRLPPTSGRLLSSGAGRAAPRLSFGDLDQWLIKVLLFAPSHADQWGGPRGPVKSLLQLARLAGVSPPLVYRWAAAMEKSGYLEKRSGRVPGLRNLDPLLAEWRGRYRLYDNELIGCRPVFAERVDDQYINEFLGHLRDFQRPDQAFALSGHQACRFFRARHSEARSIHLYVSGDVSVFLEALQLALDPNPAAPIVLLGPRHRRSVLRGAARIEGVGVCDVLQVYLDLYHLQDRGREQADFLYDRILAPLFRAAAEPPHAV